MYNRTGTELLIVGWRSDFDQYTRPRSFATSEAVENFVQLACKMDLEKFAKTNVPLLINSCEVDDMYPAEKQKIGDEILGNGKHAPGYERTYWEGCTHGFAVRGDISNPKVKAGREGAFKATVEWFIKYL